MDGKPTNLVREMLFPAFRLLKLMTSIDETNSVIILVCWFLIAIQEMGFIWVDAQIKTCTYELLTAVIPRSQALKIFIRLFGAKIILTTTHSAIAQYRDYTEGKVTKRIRRKMTLLLLESFLSLDYTTQCNAQVIRDFQSANGFSNSKVIACIQEVIRLIVYSFRAVIICCSLAIQVRHRERLATIPYICMWLCLDMAIKQVQLSLGRERHAKRKSRKSRVHRRRETFAFPFQNREFRRETILRNLGPWIRSEYEMAADTLMQKKPKSLWTTKKLRFSAFSHFYNLMSLDLLTISFVYGGSGLSLPTFNFMMEMVNQLRTNLIMISHRSANYVEWFGPNVLSYFKSVDMHQTSNTSDCRVLRTLETGFDVKGEDITFCYPQQFDDQQEKPSAPPKPALENLTFHFETGKMHALVGDNGCGKTTLVQLLSQLYTSYSGTIMINDNDIKSYNVKEVRTRMSVMFQDIAKPPFFSVAENIGIGDISAISNLETIKAAAKEHNVSDFISLDTIIGDLYQQHKDPDEKWQTDLSGGQWQKIALARTFMRKDSDLVILDEPTSALDVEAEHQFFQQLKSLRKDKTTIFITHKYVTTATADCIHFMQGGKIVERGTHSELMTNKGEYARRYTLQTQGYTNS